ncbi:hypothetical protein RhiirA4_473249 [Rhizophagus irregularis]|uniref:Uncharacterized protein n=1 Tax=Rhizophagus irregularis TaxID=588596 RepID=A0A2I1H6D0_9GLOM|nr:hypothetical protein RhiirA4_473249 [Rhizophagus irregularis]
MTLLFIKYEIDLIDKKAPLKTQSDVITVCTELLVEIKLRNLKHFFITRVIKDFEL